MISLAQVIHPPSSGRIDFLPRLLHELSSVQRFVLAKVAVHCWNYDGRIPYIPANAHQAFVASTLATPDVRLLLPTSLSPSYSLSRRGEIAVRRLFRLVDIALVEDREREFDEMRYFVRNKWETSD